MAEVRRCRWIVSGVAAAMLVVKLLLAGLSRGTNDADTWTLFAGGVAQAGPVGVYALDFPGQLYNHPPLIGYWLALLNVLETWGLSIRFSIRATASLADVATAVLVFELLRTRTTLARATASGVLVALSPVLLVISGFHANTDPIFVMLVILAAYLLVDRRVPALAGFVLALALGVKIVPVVVLPLFAVFALLAGIRVLLQVVAGFAALTALIWLPALLAEFPAVLGNVIGYSGIAARPWGIAQPVHWLGDPDWAVWLLTYPWRFVALAVAALLPAWLVLRRRDQLPAALGLSLGLFLVLSPAFGHQYMVWPAAALFFVGLVGATAYNVLAGALIIMVYHRWNGGWPWDLALASSMTGGELALAGVVWVVLTVAVLIGVVAQLRLTPLPASGGRARPTVRAG
jgi:hypothetical protein